MNTMFKKTGYEIQVTLRTKTIAKDNPGMIYNFRSVIVSDSIVSAFGSAIAQCPSDKEIMGISLQEIPVFTADPLPEPSK